ncbi:MAG TPA: hypothetical protein VHX11_12045 [Acidobacteriaceae bacterium]|jgi:hypothetical protein|nr:hypothetical protein [Acidobacteriaceae bacterium]
MSGIRQRRGWLLVAAIAIGAALLLLLVPHAHSGAAWLAVLPVLFAGVISPLSLLSPLAYVYLGRAPESPFRPFSFQRPPPIRLG